jgi:transposase
VPALNDYQFFRRSALEKKGNMRYSKSERSELVLLAARGDLSQREVVERFHAKHPTRPRPSQSMVCKLMKRFRETGTVGDRQKTGRPRSATGKDAAAMTIATVSVCGRQSIRDLEKSLHISRSSVHRILRRERFRPYKCSFHQLLVRDDSEKRESFCLTLMDKINDDPTLLTRILFSDEATLYLDGEFNSQNTRFWSDSNPRYHRQNHSQTAKKVMVWAGILGTEVIGPFFLDTNLTGDGYVKLIKGRVLPRVRELRGTTRDVWFQHDGASVHFQLGVRDFLSRKFPERWIGRGGPIPWPARSPDLSPLDFFLWGYLRDRVFETTPSDLGDLRRRIETTLHAITPQTLQNVLRSFGDRLGHCYFCEGGIFEHQL